MPMMSLEVKIPSHQKTALAKEAGRLGISEAEVIRRMLDRHLPGVQAVLEEQEREISVRLPFPDMGEEQEG